MYQSRSFIKGSAQVLNLIYYITRSQNHYSTCITCELEESAAVK
jgi:hypothetical protein